MVRHLSIAGFLLVVLSGCSHSTIEVELAPSSEGQLPVQGELGSEEVAIQKVQLPRKVFLEVPFTVQAPHANWDNPYQEACEEASVIMVDYYLRGELLNPDQANREIVQLTNWQEANGYKYDVSLEELSQIVESYYGYNTRIIDSVTPGAIMHELAKGSPVVVPAAGRDLGNPYFSGAGPWYHMLVIIGYDKRDFITNDPGTKRGQDYKYRHNVLIDAIHDWTGVKEDIRNGPKRMLVIEQTS